MWLAGMRVLLFQPGWHTSATSLTLCWTQTKKQTAVYEGRHDRVPGPCLLPHCCKHRVVFKLFSALAKLSQMVFLILFHFLQVLVSLVLVNLPQLLQKQTNFKNNLEPWLVWLSGLSASLQTKGSPARFPVRAYAWVASQVPSGGCVRGNHTLLFLSLSFSLLSPLSKNK